MKRYSVAKLIFPARHGGKLPLWSGTVGPQGINPERRKILAARRASLVEPQRDAAEPVSSTVARHDSAVLSFGIVPASQKITVQSFRSAAEAHCDSVPERKIHPAPHGIRPAGLGDAVFRPKPSFTTPRHLPRRRPPSRPLERGGECHRGMTVTQSGKLRFFRLAAGKSHTPPLCSLAL